MCSENQAVLALIENKGMDASEITHALRVLGNGSMKAGLVRVQQYYLEEEGIMLGKGRIQGLIGGTIITGLIAGGFFIWNRWNADHRAEGAKISQSFASVMNAEKTDEEETETQEPG